VAAADRKLAQLCAQAEEALSLALAGECEDPRLHQLSVQHVNPAPDASRLLVVVASANQETDEVYLALERASGLLRSAVASELHRRRTPMLSFIVLPLEEAT
jgi:ribosome-binding factor A